MKELWKIFITFFKIGAFTLGGGYAMIPIIHKEVSANRKWLSDEDFLDILSISQAAPGPLAVNVSVFTGYRIKGIPGLIAATLGSVLPSFLIIIAVASVFIGIEDNEIVQRVFMGIRPAVVALIAVPVITMGKTAGVNKKTMIVPILAALLVAGLKITPVYVILGAILIGIISVRRGKKDDIR